MNTSFHIATAVALSVIANLSSAADAVQPTVLTAEGGRYVFGQVNHQRADQFMLDTKTGRLWRVVDSSGGGIVLEPITYSDGNGNRLDAPKEVSPGQSTGSSKK